MPTDEEMSLNERRKYLKKMKPLYESSSRAEKSRLLGEMEQVTGLHRKSLLRLLHQESLQRHKSITKRSRIYGNDVEQIVVTVWESLDYVCSERLTPALLSTAEHLERFGEVKLTDALREQLSHISRPTVERMLIRHREHRDRLPQRGAERANQMTKGVPMGRIPWDIGEPGHFEVDLVHHSGGSSLGEYVHTLQLIDVATGWSERVAVLGRSQKAMVAGFRQVLSRLPFAVKQLHPDNGSEFFNQHLVRFFGEEITGLRLSRSRPFHKNDNRFVEQKNDTLVRRYFGTQRLEEAELGTMNALYEQMWLYYNLFQPVMHLSEKSFSEGKVVRRWDQAQTPYMRLTSYEILSFEQLTQLQARYEQTNPRALRQTIQQQLQLLWRRPAVEISSR
jgi:hypothetical protein